MNMSRCAIEIADFSFSVGKARILKGISLDVGSGEYLSIIGPNGAGKTTLLKCLNRILTGGEGAILIRGKPLHDYSQIELAKLVGYVPQADGRSLPVTAHELVMMGRYPYLSPFSSITPEDETAVDEALERTGMTGFSDRLYNTLSGGERQKIFIAAALAQEAAIMLLDEPTTFLDPHHRADIFGILRDINRTGVTILSVTHDINSAVLFSERILALKDGTTSYCGSADGVMDNRVLRELFGKDFLFVDHPTMGKKILVGTVE